MHENIKEIFIKSSIDLSMEPAFLYVPENAEKRLIVSLHSWSIGKDNNITSTMRLAEETSCSVIWPEFRGPNLAANPRARQACASKLAMQDIVDAAEEACRMKISGPNEIFLIGGSGGAHMALMCAGYRPGLWKAVIASCPITELIDWHAENKNYAPHIEACCGGAPDTPERIKEYKSRSPLYHAGPISRASVYILHGKHDLSVPFAHSLKMYDAILGQNPGADAYLEIFNGGHEHRIDRAAGIIKKLSEGENRPSKITG